MEIVCENCNTRHYLSDDKIPLETKTGKCKKCGAAITVLGKNEANNFNAKESLKMAITQPEFEGTNVRQFLAHKGSVIIKEFRKIATLTSNYYYDNKAYQKAVKAYNEAEKAYKEIPKCKKQDYEDSDKKQACEDKKQAYEDLKAFDNFMRNPTIIVSTLILGIIKGKDQQTIFGVKLEYIDTNVFIDFDELPELMEAFDFIQLKADILKPQKCDYTELIYSTKDDAKFGFFQDDEQEQTAFTKWQGETAFLKLSDLLTLKNHLLKAQEHLISRGASIDNY